jgi:hypothetical protein
MTNLADISTVGNGGDSVTLIDLTNGGISLSTGHSPRLILSPTGQVVVGSNTTVSAMFYVNGSSASPISNSASGGGSIALDLSTANSFTINLTASATLANPLNATAGQSGIVFLVQPAAGGATVAYGTAWKWPNGAAPTATVTANAVDAVSYVVRTGGASPVVAAQFISNFK